MSATIKLNLKSKEEYKEYLVKEREAFYKRYPEKSNEEHSLDDFERVRTIGEGGCGSVLLMKHIPDGNYYALKVQEKKKLVKSKQVDHVLAEKRMLHAIKCAFLVNLVFSFKDNSNLYLVLPFISGGDLFYILKTKLRLDEKLAKFYAAQVVLGLEYLHYMDVAYRDLKPENILIDSTGYLKITDMGFCKIVKGRTYTFCGTPEYIAPEIIFGDGYGTAVDWWSLGVFIYDIIHGFAPFYHRNMQMVFNKIVECNYTFPDHFSEALKDLIPNLLEPDLSRRFGNLKSGADDIKAHPWFNDVDWLALLNQKIDPPYVPKVTGPGDASNFESLEEHTVPKSRKNLYKDKFQDF